MDASTSTSSTQNQTDLTGTLYRLIIAMRIVLNPAISNSALLAAIINVVTFARINLSHGVNLNLLILSTTDFFISVIAVLLNFSFVALWLGVRSLAIRQILFINLRIFNYPATASTVVTSVIAVVRCLSVMKPLSFHLVTACRQVAAIALGCLIGFSVPIYNQILVHVVLRSESNRDTHAFDAYRNAFFFTCLTVNILSIVFLMAALKKSSRFQSTASSSTTDKDSRSSFRREAQVMMTVILLLTIFVVCNTP
ncbi:hypothetical protein RRG08_050443 [Elysia crispata]|uniref:G-protein coupled receptors family 1 profile domain-containing protein n=1 Tax=Elysia crispata TaxID=231223 RepID=A0AAE1DI47_9GAST|nr:hypothetical protein RRG08_050443 [Elysia crispata]